MSVSPDGELYYAVLLASAKSYGSEPFIDEVPKIIFELIRRVTTT